MRGGWTYGSLFTGIGGLDLALEAFGCVPLWQAESDPHARAVLAHHWPGVRCFQDVKEIDEQAAAPNVICGGFPCQDISLAGSGAGIDGERSGLWREFARIVRVLRPDIVFVENVAALLGRGLDRVLRDLAALGYDAEWETFRASDVGAPHLRDRVFVLAYADRERVRQLAERHQRGRRGEREAECEHAEPLDDRTPLADTAIGGREGTRGGRDARGGTGADGAGGRLLADADRGDGNGRERESRRSSAGRAAAGRHGEGIGLAYPYGDGREGGQAEHRAVADAGGGGDVADAGGGRQRARERELRAGEPDAHGGGPRHVADADRGRREGIRLAQPGGVEGEPRSGIDGRRHVGYVHRFPPGPSAIAGWDGPQPAIRRGDDGVPGRSHRLRLLGNACVPQQAVAALDALIARAVRS